MNTEDYKIQGFQEDKPKKVSKALADAWDGVLTNWYAWRGPTPRAHGVQIFFFLLCMAAFLPWVG
jgi:hypothetical protein